MSEYFWTQIKHARNRCRIRAYGMAWLALLNAACAYRSADDPMTLAFFLIATVGLAFMTGYWYSMVVYYNGMLSAVDSQS